MINPNEEPSGLLADLRARVVARLAAAAAFAEPNPVPVIDGGRGDIGRSVREILDKRTAGLCLVVTIPRVDPWEASPQGIVPTISVAVCERPDRNWSEKGKQLAIEDASECVFQSLGFNEDGYPGWEPAEIWNRLQFAGIRQAAAGTDRVIMEVLFTTATVVKVSTE